LLTHGVTADQIISINFEDFDFAHLTNPQNLYAYIKEGLQSDRQNYLFLDEIQNVADFQKVVDSIFLKDNVDIYMTSSNAHLLSGELATYLTGRYVTIEMLPLSFREFVTAHGLENRLAQAYRQYIETSSFPFVAIGDLEPSLISDYMESLYHTLLLKDVVARKKIIDVMMLERVIRFMADNIGNELSTKKISDTMTSMGRKINVRTVESYINGFMEAYLLYQTKRYDIKGKQHLKTQKKYYFVDIGLRNYMLSETSFSDVGHVLENVIYLELIRRGYNVSVGKIDKVEVDFVAQNLDGLVYYQVAATVRDEATLQRELRSLQKIPDNYPKYLLTLDEDPAADFEGIRKMNALDFLMGKN